MSSRAAGVIADVLLAGARVVHTMAPSGLTLFYATFFDKLSYILKRDNSNQT